MSAFYESHNGLVVEKDWTGEDSTNLGAGFTEDRGDWDSELTYIKVPSNSATRECVLRYTGATVATPFVQAYLQAPNVASSFENAAIIARYKNSDYSKFGSTTSGLANCYMMQDSDNGFRLNTLVSGVGTQVDVDANIVKGSTAQFYCEDGLQEGYRVSDGATVSGSNTDHDGVTDGYVALLGDVSSGITNNVIFGAILWICESKYIVVDELPSGYKAKILNGSDTVIAQATESGGAATIDCSLFGGCTESLPSGGFAHIIVTDASDVELQRISTNVYPGNTYTYADPAPTYSTLPAQRFEVWSDVEAAGGTMLGVLTGSGVLTASEDKALNGKETLELTVTRKCAGWAHLSPGAVIRIIYANTYDEWRIKELEETQDRKGTLIGSVSCESIRYDLMRGGLIEKLDAAPSGVLGVGSLASPYFELYQQVPSDHIDVVLGDFSPFIMGPVPSFFVRGTVDPTDPVDMIYDWDTGMSALDELAVVADNSELDVRRGGSTTYLIDLLSQRGAGASIPIFRVGKNVISVERRDSVAQQCTRVYPQGGGAAGERTTIAENAFEIAAIPGGLQFTEDLVLEDGQLEGMGLYALRPDGSLTAVTASTAPNVVTLADQSGLSIGELITFKRNAAGDDLTYLEAPSSSAVYGIVPQVHSRSDIPSVNNLLQNAFFTNWTAGLPDTWTVQGATASVSQNTNPLYTEYGPSSAHFMGQPGGDCLIGGPITVTPTETRPHFTAQLNLWVVSGAVTLEIWDITDPANVVRYPVDVGNRRSVTSVANNWSTLLLPLPHEFTERDPNSGALQTRTFSFYICADQVGTEAYIDAAMFTQTAGGAEVFHDGRGSNALWIAGNDFLFLYQDPLEQADANVLDLNSLDEVAFPQEGITLGGYATLWVPELDDYKTTNRIVRVRRNLLKETDVQIDFATELDELTRQLERTQRRRKRVRAPVPESQMPPACGANPRSWLSGDLVVEWDRTPGAARYELRDTTGTVGTPEERFNAGVRLVRTDDTLWILKDPGQAALPVGTSLPHPANIAEIIMEAYNHWGVPGNCYEVVAPQNLGPPGICLSVIADPSARQTFCNGVAQAGGSSGLLLRSPALVVDSSMIAQIIPGQTYFTLCHEGSTVGGSSSVVGYYAPVWSSISGFMRTRLDKVGGTSFGHSFNTYGAAPDVKWSGVSAEDDGAGGHLVQITFGDAPTADGPDWNSSDVCCREDVGSTEEWADQKFQPGVYGGGGGTLGPWVHYMNGHKSNVITVNGLSNQKIKLTRNYGDAYLGPDTITTGLHTGSAEISATDFGDPGTNDNGGGWWDKLEILNSSDVVIETILGSNCPSGKIWMGSEFDVGSGYDLTSHIAVNYAGTIGLVDDGFIFEENWGISATAIDYTKYTVDPPGSVVYDSSKNALRFASQGRIMRSDKGNFDYCVSEAVVEVEDLDASGVGAAVLAGAGLDVQSKLRATFDNGDVYESPGAITGDLAVFATDIAFTNLLWPADAQILTIEQIQTGTGVGLACSQEVRLNLGAHCCPPGGTILVGDLPTITADCLLTANHKFWQLDTCAGGTGIGIAVTGYIKKTNLCPNIDIDGAYYFEAMYFEEYDPVNFPDDYVLVRHDTHPAPLPTITGAPQGDAFGWATVITTEDPLGINPIPGTVRGSDASNAVAKKWFVRVILRDLLGQASAHLDTAPVVSPAYGWCP